MRLSSYIAWLLLLTVAVGCKKGEEDPFLSLVSRKARLSGEWKVESAEQSFNFGELRNVRYAADSGITYTYEDSTFLSHSTEWNVSFSNEGTYVWEQIESFPADAENGTLAYNEVRKEKGDWKFTGGNGVPNKSELILLATEQSSERSDQGSNISITSISGPVNGRVYTLVQLSSDALKMSYMVTESLPFEQRIEQFDIELSKLN